MKFTQLEFRDRFTMGEKRSIYSAAEALVDIRIFLDDLAAVDPAVGVDTTDPRTVGGVQLLEAAGLIGLGRAVEILGEESVAPPLDPAKNTPVGGYALGQILCVTAPFNTANPDAYPIIGFGDGTVVLSIGEFNLQFVKAV